MSRRYPMRYEYHNLHGGACERLPVYDVPVHITHQAATKWSAEMDYPDYWPAVTDIPCPIATCDGTVRWAEAGFVPGFRVCDNCSRAFLAGGNKDKPTLIRDGSRRIPHYFRRTK